MWARYRSRKDALIEKDDQNAYTLTGAEVKMHAADFKLNGTVLIDDIVIRPNRPCTFDDAIFKAKHVQARFGLLSLLKGEPRIKTSMLSMILS